MEKLSCIELLEKFYWTVIKLCIFIKENGKNENFKKIAPRLQHIADDIAIVILNKHFSICEELIEKLNCLEKEFETDISALHDARAKVILRFIRDYGNLIMTISKLPDYEISTYVHRSIIHDDFEHTVHVFLFDTDIDSYAYEQEYVRFLESILNTIFRSSKHFEIFNDFNPADDVREEILKANEPFVKSFIKMCELTTFNKVTELVKGATNILKDYLQWKPLNEEDVKKIQNEISLLKVDGFSMDESDDDDWYYNPNRYYRTNNDVKDYNFDQCSSSDFDSVSE